MHHTEKSRIGARRVLSFWALTASTCMAVPGVQAQDQASTQQPAQVQKICVGQACLGMTLAEAAALKLVPPEEMAFKLDVDKSPNYGLDGGGQRVNLAEYGDLDSNGIRQFTTRVKTICRVESVGARMDTEDGRYALSFAPDIRDGKGQLVLTTMALMLLRDASDAKVRHVVAQAKAKYGNAYTEKYTEAITRPNVALYDAMIMARSLQLRLPAPDVAAALMAQPGCAGNAGK